MRDKSVSDFVASTMNNILSSPSHQSLFASRQKFASTACDKCHKEECSCEDENDVNDADDKEDDEKDTNDANDFSNFASYDVTIDSLLTVSAALDCLGMEKESAVSLKLASLVIQAKAKDPKEEKAKAKAKKEAEKAKAKAAKEKEVAKAKALKEKEAKEKQKQKEKEDKEKAKEKTKK